MEDSTWRTTFQSLERLSLLRARSSLNLKWLRQSRLEEVLSPSPSNPTFQIFSKLKGKTKFNSSSRFPITELHPLKNSRCRISSKSKIFWEERLRRRTSRSTNWWRLHWWTRSTTSSKFLSRPTKSNRTIKLIALSKVRRFSCLRETRHHTSHKSSFRAIQSWTCLHKISLNKTMKTLPIASVMPWGIMQEPRRVNYWETSARTPTSSTCWEPQLTYNRLRMSSKRQRGSSQPKA